MEDGDILGQFLGIVEEVAKPNGLRKGARVIVPFQIARTSLDEAVTNEAG